MTYERESLNERGIVPIKDPRELIQSKIDKVSSIEKASLITKIFHRFDRYPHAEILKSIKNAVNPEKITLLKEDSKRSQKQMLTYALPVMAADLTLILISLLNNIPVDPNKITLSQIAQLGFADAGFVFALMYAGWKVNRININRELKSSITGHPKADAEMQP